MSVKIALKEEHIKAIRDICSSFNNDPGELINVLHKSQDHFDICQLKYKRL